MTTLERLYFILMKATMSAPVVIAVCPRDGASKASESAKCLKVLGFKAFAIHKKSSAVSVAAHLKTIFSPPSDRRPGVLFVTSDQLDAIKVKIVFLSLISSLKYTDILHVSLIPRYKFNTIVMLDDYSSSGFKICPSTLYRVS